MQVAVTSIVSLYEIDRLSVAEIAESEGIDVTAVKVFLSKFSAQYRADCGQAAQLKIGLELKGSEAGTQYVGTPSASKSELEPGQSVNNDTRLSQFDERGMVTTDKSSADKLGFSLEEGEEVRAVILNIARNEDTPPNVRLNAAQFVFNEIKGRNDSKNMADEAGKNNIFIFQEALIKQRGILDKVRAAKQVSNQKLPEVLNV